MTIKTIDNVPWMEIYGQFWEPANKFTFKTKARISHHKGIGWTAWVYPRVPGTCLGTFNSFQQAARAVYAA